MQLLEVSLHCLKHHADMQHTSSIFHARADGTTRVQQLEGRLAEAQSAAAASASEHDAAMASTVAEVERLREAASHAQQLQQELQESYASLQDRHRSLVNTREVHLLMGS